MKTIMLLTRSRELALTNFELVTRSREQALTNFELVTRSRELALMKFELQISLLQKNLATNRRGRREMGMASKKWAWPITRSL